MCFQVRADENLRAGFNAFGVSQGSNVIRGYIQRYNDPPVIGFMSLSSPIVGVAAFPMCPPDAPLIVSTPAILPLLSRCR